MKYNKNKTASLKKIMYNMPDDALIVKLRKLKFTKWSTPSLITDYYNNRYKINSFTLL